MKRLTLLAVCLLLGCGRSQPHVVLYCSQDEEFATELLEEFTRQTGVVVRLKTDTEADKSVSLYQSLVREARHPRCDVFWNNEILNTLRLKQHGLLEAYATPAAAPFPEWAKAGDHTWHAFAARARVLIVHNRLKPDEQPRSILELAHPRWKGRIAIAKPLFGTTATHAVCLFQVLGKERAEAFYRDLRKNAAVLPGNKDVAVAVTEGRYDVGFTDTDDAIIEVNRGMPVTIVYPDRLGEPDGLDGLGTLFIPNTLGVIKGSPNPDAARKLVDFLLSPDAETRLAQGKSAQIPLNPNVNVKPPVESPATVKPMPVDFEKAAAMWDDVQTFLRNEFAR